MKHGHLIILGTIIFIFLAGLTGFYLFNNDLSSKNSEMNVVATGSMEPALYRGDIVIVEKNPEKLKVGDIVIYNPIWFNQL